MRVVYDTNIYISAIGFGGIPRTLIELVVNKQISLFISSAIITEIETTLTEKLSYTSSRATEIISQIRSISRKVEPITRVNKITTYPKDNRILECALAAEADYLVTGDKKHLLPLKKFKKITIVTPKEFLDIVNQTN